LFPWGVAVDALRSFSFDKVKRNKRNGTAKLTVKVPGPGDVELAKTKRVKGAKKGASAAGKVKLPVRSLGKAKQELKAKGKAKVEAEVTYAPRRRRSEHRREHLDREGDACEARLSGAPFARVATAAGLVLPRGSAPRGRRPSLRSGCERGYG
jgi:hypothetical protein